MLSRFYKRGYDAAVRKYAGKQPSLSSAGVFLPVKATGLPSPGTRAVGVPPNPPELAATKPLEAKKASQVGMGFTSKGDISQSISGMPQSTPDKTKRQTSVISRAFQANDDNYATSSMTPPGAVISP